MYVQEVRRLVDLCYLDCSADKDKLIRNSIIAGINSTKACQQCISKGSRLSLDDCIKICQMDDATRRQVQALCPVFRLQSYYPSTQDLKPASIPPRQGSLQWLQGERWESFWGNWPQSRQDYRHSMAPMCEYCGRAPHNSRQECRALGMECYTCHKFGHLSNMCRQNMESDKTEVKHRHRGGAQDCLQNEYTTPFYTTND